MRRNTTLGNAGPFAARVGLVLLLPPCLAACIAFSSSPPAETPGSPSLNGCLVQQAPLNLPPADVVLTETTAQGATMTVGSDSVKRVTIRIGQRLELRLSATVHWAMAPRPAPSVLRVEEPESWYAETERACVWRFTAVGVGVTRFDLGGGLVCPPETACPALARIAKYGITVQ